MLLLDTNHLDALMFEHERRDKLVARLESATDHEVVTTIVNVQEKFEGWLSVINGKRTTLFAQVPYYAQMRKLIHFFADWRLLPFDVAAVIEQERLKKVKTGLIKPNDLKIAAIALCHNAIVLTRDVKHFSVVPGLRVEDWLADDP